MKKVLAVALALCMVFAMGTVAFAATLDETNTSGEVIIRTTYNAEEDVNYAVEIPATVEDIAWGTLSTELTYTPTIMKLETGHKVTMAVSGNGLMKLAPEDTTGIAYALGGATTADFALNQVGDAHARTISVDITAAAWDAAYVGTYQDTLTFEMAYVAA